MNPTHRTWLIAAAIVAVFLHLLISFAKAHYTIAKTNGECQHVYLINNFTGKVRGITPSGYMFDVTDIPEK